MNIASTRLRAVLNVHFVFDVRAESLSNCNPIGGRINVAMTLAQNNTQLPASLRSKPAVRRIQRRPALGFVSPELNVFAPAPRVRGKSSQSARSNKFGELLVDCRMRGSVWVGRFRNWQRCHDNTSTPGAFASIADGR